MDSADERIAAVLEAAERRPPPLEPFGLELHHDGRWTHEGQPIRNPKIRASFDRSVRFLPKEGVYVVQMGRFRGLIEVEEAPFFVCSFDAPAGTLLLSDRSAEPLDPSGLQCSSFDGAFLCRVKADPEQPIHLARFSHAAQAELLNAVEEICGEPRLRMRGELFELPDLV